MMDKLSHMQILSKIEELNTNVYVSLLKGDINAFNKVIEEFEDSGIMEQENFEMTRKVYRFTNPIFSIYGFPYIPGSSKKIDKYIEWATGYSIDTIMAINHEQHFYAMINSYNQPREYDDDGNYIRTANKKTIEQRQQQLIDYIEKLDHLYDSNIQSRSLHLVLDDKKYRKPFIDKVYELSKLKKKLTIIFNFELVGKKNPLTDDDYNEMSDLQKLNYFTNQMDNLYQNTQNKKDVLTYSVTKKHEAKHIPVMTSYLRAKDIAHTAWKNYYGKQILSMNVWFYIEMAMYLGIPSGEEIEKFLNFHGFTINSEMCVLPEKKIGNYYVKGKDMMRWLNAGIDYNIINAMFGWELEKPEKKQIKKTKKQTKKGVVK